MEKMVALFGAGKIGKAALKILRHKGIKVLCFLDNDSRKYNRKIMNVPILGVEEFVNTGYSCQVILTCASRHRKEILQQLNNSGISDAVIFDEKMLWSKLNRESLVSYCHESDLEDVILYHVFRNEVDVFYIDVGSNDPWLYSVTRLLYSKGGHGINIDPLSELIELSDQERPRDINICVGIGAKRSRTKLYCQGTCSGGLSTVVENNKSIGAEERYIDIVPLKDICSEYVPSGQDIHLLKIDVEGFEEDVLLGADFAHYRPWVVVIESTLPGTDIPCYEKWEKMIFKENYSFVYQFGVNRYYLASEHEALRKRFLKREELLEKYRIFRAELMMY